MWQLKATLASSQSSQRMDTFPRDQFGLRTFNARLSKLCSGESGEEKSSLPDHDSPSLSQTGLFGQPFLHTCLLNQETDIRLIQIHLLLPKCVNQSSRTPWAFPQTKGLNGTAFVRATGSFLIGKKNSSLCGPYFPRTFQQLDDVRKRTTSHGSRQRQTPSQQGPSHIFCKIFAPTMLQAIATTKAGNGKLWYQMPTLVWIFQAFQRICQGRNRVFEMFLPQTQAFFCSAQDIFFASWIVTFLTAVPGCFHWSKGFRFLTVTRLFSSCRLARFSVVTTQLFTFFPFNSFVDCFAESVPVCVNQRRSPLLFFVLCVDEGPLCTHLISSQCWPICSFPYGRLCESLAELRFFEQEAMWCLDANHQRPLHCDCLLGWIFCFSRAGLSMLWIGLSPSFCWADVRQSDSSHSVDWRDDPFFIIIDLHLVFSFGHNDRSIHSQCNWKKRWHQLHVNSWMISTDMTMSTTVMSQVVRAPDVQLSVGRFFFHICSMILKKIIPHADDDGVWFDEMTMRCMRKN